MAELRKVPGPSSPLTGSSGKVVAVVIAGIVLAVVKPWGASPAEIAVESTRPAASAQPSPAPTGPVSAFDFGVFEGFEPQPAWEIWPAGREISFGFAMKVGADIDAASPTPGPSDGASSSPGDPAPTPSPSPALPTRDPGPPMWSQTITISPASTLTVVAINMPLEYRIPMVRLSRLDPGGGRVLVPVVRLPSPWPDHFLVIGIDDGTGIAGIPAWPPGAYKLDLRIDPGGWARTIMIDVRALPSPTSSPPGSSAPPAGSDPAPTRARD